MKGSASVILFLIILFFAALFIALSFLSDDNKVKNLDCLIHFPISTRFLIMCNSTLLEKPTVNRIMCKGVLEKDMRQEIIDRVYTILNSTNWTSENIEELTIEECNVTVGNASICNGTKNFTIKCYSNTILRENGSEEVELEFYGDVR